MSHKIIRSIARPDAAVVRALGAAGVATVHEAQGRTGLMRPYMRPIYPAARVAGAAGAISIPPGHNLTIHASIGGRRAGVMRPYMRPIYPAARVAGTAVTISIPPGDNLMIHASIEVCRPGDVLVVAPPSECSDG